MKKEKVDLKISCQYPFTVSPDELGGELLDLVLLHAGVLLEGAVLLEDPQEPTKHHTTCSSR